MTSMAGAATSSPLGAMALAAGAMIILLVVAVLGSTLPMAWARKAGFLAR